MTVYILVMQDNNRTHFSGFIYHSLGLDDKTSWLSTDPLLRKLSDFPLFWLVFYLFHFFLYIFLYRFIDYSPIVIMGVFSARAL